MEKVELMNELESRLWHEVAHLRELQRDRDRKFLNIRKLFLERRIHRVTKGINELAAAIATLRN